MESIDINGSSFEIVQGDITKQDTEAIVNAANKKLAPGGGVAGAIHREAGPKLYEECKEIGGCDTGHAKLTDGYELEADYVIHTVGPVYSDSKNAEKYLRKAYRNSLKLVEENDIKTVSFPALSTGAFGYPVKEAAEVAFDEIDNFLKKTEKIELIKMVLYGKDDYEIHVKKMKEKFS